MGGTHSSDALNAAEHVLCRATAAAVEQVDKSYRSDWLRGEFGRYYSTLEDFRRADPTLRRVVVIGCTGSGKSTMLNVIGGWQFVQTPPAYDYQWIPPACYDASSSHETVFKAQIGSKSVTNCTAFANLYWTGDLGRPFIAIDTPGHDDTQATDLDDGNTRNLLRQLAADLHNKLKAMNHVDCLLVLHNDVVANRLNPATYTILRMIDEKFAMTEQSVWENVVVAYSKCNAHETTWRHNLNLKKRQLQEEIRDKVPNCKVDVPIIALGGGQFRGGWWTEEDNGRSRSQSRSRSRSPHRRLDEPSTMTAAKDGLEAFWDIIETLRPLDTSLLQPFEGPDQKWEKIIEARDAAEARAKAAIIYVSVVTKLALLLVVLFWRAFFLPSWISRWVFFNCRGPIDEVVWIILLACWVGPWDTWYSCAHFWQVWLWPLLKPFLTTVI